MNATRILLLTVVCMMMAGCVPSALSGPLPLLETPITIEGIEVSLSSATQADSYKVMGTEQKPTSPGDEMLVLAVNCAVADGMTADEMRPIIDGWSVAVRDENGREDVPGITRITFVDAGAGSSASVTWVFAVDEAAGSLTLRLPEGHDIDLAPALTD